MADVIVTPEDMYAQLRAMDKKLDALVLTMEREHLDHQDHESRLRELEAREDLSRRVDKVETDLRGVQLRVWSFPTLAGLVACAALFAAIANYLP